MPSNEPVPSLKSKLREPLNQLILLGCLCQGYSWDIIGVQVPYVLGALACLYWRGRKPIPSQHLQVFLLIFAFLFFRLIAREVEVGVNWLIFFGGNAVFVYQLTLLLQPLNARQKQWALVCAVMHLGIGTQVVVDYSAILLLLAALYLLPRTMFELVADGFRHCHVLRTRSVSKREILALAGLATVFFLFFPRVPMVKHAAPVLQAGTGAGPLDNRLDSAGGGGDSSNALIFRIEGEGIEYIKTSALDEFDGNYWSASLWAIKRRDDLPKEGAVPQQRQQRSVDIFRHDLLQNKVPADGYVHRVWGSFYQRVGVSGDGAVRAPYQFRRNESYQYISTKYWPTDQLNENQRARYTKLPPQTPRLQNWLRGRIGNERNPATQAEILKQYFHAEYQYELGAPDLDRLNPIDDFVFNARTGHCERFASALAVLLRMQGVPARVALGYVARERNDLGEFYNVRVSHAHAWTEVFIEGQGWTIYDATAGGGIEMETRQLALTVFEWIEHMWYSRIVEFGSDEQQEVVTVVNHTFSAVLGLLADGMSYLFAGLLLAIAALTLHRVKLPWGKWTRRSKASAVVEAQHFYGRMARSLAKQKVARQAGQTPLEFLQTVETLGHPCLQDIRFVTQCFCAARYGNSPITGDQERELEQAIIRIRRRQAEAPS